MKTLILTVFLTLITTNSYASPIRKVLCNTDQFNNPEAILTIEAPFDGRYNFTKYIFTIQSEGIINYFLSKNAVKNLNGNRIIFNLKPIPRTYHHYKATISNNAQNTYYVKRVYNGIKVEAFKGKVASESSYIADWYFDSCF